MHVSLSRRSHRVGLSMQYWLWFCFGLLAVLPWQVIRGQEETDSAHVDIPSANRAAETPRTSPMRGAAKPEPNWLSAPTRGSLIFRSQTPPPGGPPQNIPVNPGYDLTPIDGMQPDSSFGNGFLEDDSMSGRSGEAYGILGRAGYFTGPAIGRQHQILPVEMMPYAFLDNTMFFADIRGFTDFANGYGTNLGGGIRHYLPRFDRIFGFNSYFDYDNTSGAMFREVGFGVESLGELYDLRANAYFPFGSQSEQLSINNISGSQKFVGHFLQVDQQRTVANALHGFDSEIGVPVPGRIGNRHDIRVFGGGYWFEGTQIQSFGGWKARIQGNVLPGVSVQLQVSNDQVFDTNVVFGATWTYGGYRQPDTQRKTQFDRMTTPVIRQYNMVVGLATQLDRGVTVINPTTGNPYFFEHVASYATGPTFDGTVEHPFVTVADAQVVTSANDIIFVHANSTYSGVTVGLQDNVRVLGEASTIEHTVNTTAGLLTLPHPTSGTAVRPLFTNAPGNGVVLANNSEFSGFQIGDATTPGSGPSGVGILGVGISNATVRETDVSFSGAEGVLLTNTSGTMTFQGDVINAPSSGAAAFHVDGAVGTINFSDDPVRPASQSSPTAAVINNTGGFALLVENTLLGSQVNFTNSTINDSAGQGILLQNSAGQINLGNANLTNELNHGLNILNDSGAILGNGTITINGVVGDAVNIENLASTGQVSFLPTGGLNISGRQARGINLLDNAGTVGILSPVIITANGPVALPALEYSGSSGNAVFGNITISGGGQGILIDPNAGGIPDSGQFTVRGTTTISNTAGNAITINDVDSVVTFNTTTINDRSRIGVEILNTRAPVTFTGLTTITNNNVVSNFPGIDIRGNAAAATVSFQNAAITGAQGPAAAGFGGVGVNIGGIGTDANPGQVAFTSLNVTSTRGIALFANNVGDATTDPPSGGLIINQGNLSTTFDTAVDIRNSVMQVTLTSVSSVQSPTNGIRLIDNSPFNNTLATALSNYAFTVTGNAGGRGSGGSITQSIGDGIILTNTGSVQLQSMNIIQNNNGINANDMLRLTLNNLGVIQNGVDGVFARNVSEVDITGSQFTQNGIGTGTGNQIHLVADALLPLISPTNGSYLWNITDNTNLNGFNGGFITGVTGGDSVLIQSSTRLQDPVSGLTTPLVLNFTDNSAIQNVANTSILNVAWIGPESGTINLNNLQLTGLNTGIQIVNSDLNFLTNYNLLGNTVTANGGANTGLFVNTNGPTDLFVGNFVNTRTGVITDSTWSFTQNGGNAVNATPNVAMEFTTGQNSILDIFSNTVTMAGNGNVVDNAFLFNFLQSPTTVTFSNNLVTMTNEPVANGLGVEFLSTNGTVNLNGALNNIISINGVANQAGTPWFFRSPGAVTSGQFIINNFFVP